MNRLKSKETNLNTVVYQNKNGTETTYIFMRPIKYTDESGNIKDKSNEITPLINKTYSYGVIENSVKIYFPKNSIDGTKIQYKDFSIKMIPVTSCSVTPTYIDDNNITYNEAFGKGTILKYHTNINGIKEDIVLVKNTGQNEFDFALTLTNLTPVFFDNAWCLKNSSDEIVASFGKILINDSAGNSTEGTLTIEATNILDTYNIKIMVPPAFLNSDSTVYPVCIDPTTTIWETGYYYDKDGNEYEYDAIQDTGLYTTTAAVEYAERSQAYHKLGNYSSANGKIIYKIYDFYGIKGQFKNLNSYQIGNVFLNVNVESGTATTITAYPMKETWDTSDVGNNPIALCDSVLWNAYSTELSSSLTLDSTYGDRAINITEIVKGWADYNNRLSTESYKDPENGLILSSNLTSSYRNIAAVEAIDTYGVYIEMDTSSTGGDYYINNSLTGHFLKRNAATTVDASTYSESQFLKWRFEYLGNDKYYIRSLYNTNYVLCGSGDTVTLAYLPVNAPDKYKWDVSASAIGGVIIKNADSGLVLKYDKEVIKDNEDSAKPLMLVSAMSSDNVNYEQIVWSIGLVSNYVNMTSFSVTNAEWLSLGSEQNCQISVTPTNATWRTVNNFYWKSTNPSIATIDASGRITAVSDGYTNIVVTHKPTGISYIFPVTVGQAIRFGTYQIKNVASGKYMDVEGPSTAEGAYIQQWDYHTDNQEQWLVRYSGTGYYYIKSIYSNKYVAVNGGATSNGAAIIQTSLLSDACKWKITVTRDGNYKFSAKSSESNLKVLSLPYLTTANGVNLVQQTYNADTIYTDEWFLLFDASLLAIRDEKGTRRDIFITNTLDKLNEVTGFSTYLDIYSSEFTKTEMKSIMSTSKMFAVHTHGYIYDFKIGETEKYHIDDIMSTDLSNLRLAMFLTCDGGDGGYNAANVEKGIILNLVEACIYSGATTAVAFRGTTYTDACNRWFADLISKMNDDSLTLEQAIIELDDKRVNFGKGSFIERYQMSEKAVIGGNSSIKLNEIFD